MVTEAEKWRMKRKRRAGCWLLVEVQSDVWALGDDNYVTKY